MMALGADFTLGWVEKRLAPGARQPRGKATWLTLGAGVTAALVIAFFYLTGGASPTGRVVVASKDFTESRILAELVAQAIESKAGIEVERRFELSGDVLHSAMLSGQIDSYVEYTGTAFTAILKHKPITDPRAVYDQVKRDYESQFNLEWLDPLGFNNTFAILVRGDDARRLNLKTVSDAARHAHEWRAGFGQDFMSRADGYPGFARTYGLKFSEPPREMDLSLTYQALANRQVDLIAGNSTDGLIDKLGLFQLEDDRRYFPPYEAAPVFRKETLERYPQIVDAMRWLAGRLTDAEMRRLNYSVDAEKRDVKEVVREFLSRL
jgi:glycine betaine/choline ABC-type transport system substrate-binding protein